ncbi:SH3 domain-containing protein [Derxia lacustris]|uniref:SH3 domain-containing protein n=1 Tax=Derxia lacustris TaxID=764842 RepID=UPI000A173D03|nr:SH3 domain-containing protein [Derxia lacustris]
MNDKMQSWGGGTSLDLATVGSSTSALDAAMRYIPTSVAAEFAVLSAAFRPVDVFRQQLEAFDPACGIWAAIEQAKLADVRLNAVRAFESSELERVRRHVEIATSASRFAALHSATFARTKAIEELLSPSRIAAKYLKDLTSGKPLRLAAEQAARWANPYRELAGSLERFKEPLGASAIRAIVEGMAKASEPLDIRRLLERATEEYEPLAVHEEAVQLVQQVADGVSRALTLQDAVVQIIEALSAIKEPMLQRMLSTVLVPLLIAVVFAFVNPVGDFLVKKWLEGMPKQEATKQVKEAAREAVGDLRVLSELRFVSARNLAVKSKPKAKALEVGQLRFGQTVRVLDRGQDFTLVLWMGEDGKAELQGWVFSRHLKRFE